AIRATRRSGRAGCRPTWAEPVRQRAGGTEAGVTERTGHHPLLDEGSHGVGHARLTPLARPQDLEPVAEHLAPPPVVRGRVDAEGAAGGADADLLSAREDSQAEAEQGIIGRQRRCSSLRRRMYRRPVSAATRRYYSGIGHP